jgi:hypothetical protein
MSEAFERERQNNARLDELSAKVSALRGVTIDIYDSARSQEVIDSAVRLPPPPSLSLPLSPSSSSSSSTTTTHMLHLCFGGIKRKRAAKQARKK